MFSTRSTCYWSYGFAELMSCQVFSALHPRDILNLSRTNQAFRETLRSPSARGVWRAAMDRDEAPPCPEDWTGPRWAALLYDTSCQVCVVSLGPSAITGLIFQRTARRKTFNMWTITCGGGYVSLVERECTLSLQYFFHLLTSKRILSETTILQIVWRFPDAGMIMNLTATTPGKLNSFSLSPEMLFMCSYLEPPSGRPGTTRFWHLDDLQITDSKLEAFSSDIETLVAWGTAQLCFLNELEEVPNKVCSPSSILIILQVGLRVRFVERQQGQIAP